MLATFIAVYGRDEQGASPSINLEQSKKVKFSKSKQNKFQKKQVKC